MNTRRPYKSLPCNAGAAAHLLPAPSLHSPVFGVRVAPTRHGRHGTPDGRTDDERSEQRNDRYLERQRDDESYGRDDERGFHVVFWFG